jgi:hypothetical protein
LSSRALLLWPTVCDAPGSGVALSLRFPPSSPSFVGVPDRELAALSSSHETNLLTFGGNTVLFLNMMVQFGRQIRMFLP